MPHFKLTVSYDGTSFVGWQRQAAGLSVQGLLEDALAALDGGPVTVSGAGRYLDAGVHALGQVASVTLNRAIDAATVMRATNARLPPEIRVLEAQAVPLSFHARFSSTAKSYRYRIWNAEVLSPLERFYAWHVPGPLDTAAMQDAARRLAGTHDFAAFRASGAKTRTSVRTVFSSQLTCAEGAAAPLVVYEVSGDGFLRHMVRTIVGTLVEVGRGRQSSAAIDAVIASRSRASAGETAPACGLFLVSVSYAAADL